MNEKLLLKLFDKYSIYVNSIKIHVISRSNFRDVIAEYEITDCYKWTKCSEELPEMINKPQNAFYEILDVVDINANVYHARYSRVFEKWYDYYTGEEIKNPYKWRYIDKPE